MHVIHFGSACFIRWTTRITAGTVQTKQVYSNSDHERAFFDIAAQHGLIWRRVALMHKSSWNSFQWILFHFHFAKCKPCIKMYKITKMNEQGQIKITHSFLCTFHSILEMYTRKSAWFSIILWNVQVFTKLAIRYVQISKSSTSLSCLRFVTTYHQ